VFAVWTEVFHLRHLVVVGARPHLNFPDAFAGGFLTGELGFICHRTFFSPVYLQGPLRESGLITFRRGVDMHDGETC
jgi:hypothetical protein